MKSINENILIIIFIVFAVSCTEKIEMKVDEMPPRLIVEGEITTDTIAHRVKLTKSQNYFYNDYLPPVRNARVGLNDGYSTITLKESDSLPGVYETPVDYFGLPGRTYTLEISDVDVNSDGQPEEYTAVDRLNPIAQMDSIKLNYNKLWEAWEINVYALDPPTTEFYLFKALINNRYVTDSIREYWYEKDEYFNGRYTNGIVAQDLQDEKPDERVKVGDVVTFELNSISEQYYNFLMETIDELYGYDPLFSGPPSNIKSNISNGALGFFAAYAVSRSSTVVKELPEGYEFEDSK